MIPNVINNNDIVMSDIKNESSFIKPLIEESIQTKTSKKTTGKKKKDVINSELVMRPSEAEIPKKENRSRFFTDDEDI
jgi:hypothetical protein